MESLRTVNTWQLSSRATLSLLFVILFLAIGNVRASHSMSASSTLAPPFQGWLVLDGGDALCDYNDETTSANNLVCRAEEKAHVSEHE